MAIPTDTPRVRVTVPRDDTAGEVVRAYVARTVDKLVASDAGLRAGEVDAIHDARVATRRLRTALSVYGSVVDRTITDPVRDRLADLGHLLGAARDPQVELHALRHRLRAEPIELILGPVALRIDEDRSAGLRIGVDRLLDWLSSTAWADLVRDLDRLADRLPPGPDAGQPAADVLPRSARRAWRRLDRSTARIGRTEPGDERDEALHEARKAARRARYASEVAIGTVGRRAARSARRGRAVQDALGRQHDTVVRRETLRRLAIQAQLDGEDAFSYGRLHALEQGAGEAAERSAQPLLERATSKRHRRWTH